MSSPFFPVDVLKQLMMENLTEAVLKGAAHIRDPIGGSNETLFVYVTTGHIVTCLSTQRKLVACALAGGLTLDARVL